MYERDGKLRHGLKSVAIAITTLVCRTMFCRNFMCMPKNGELLVGRMNVFTVLEVYLFWSRDVD